MPGRSLRWRTVFIGVPVVAVVAIALALAVVAERGELTMERAGTYTLLVTVALLGLARAASGAPMRVVGNATSINLSVTDPYGAGMREANRIFEFPRVAAMLCLGALITLATGIVLPAL